METLKVILTKLRNFFLGLLIVLLYILAFLYKAAVAVYFSRLEVASSHTENRPSPLLVPVPFQFRIDSTKEQIPVVKFGEILGRLGSHDDEDDKRCAVCLTCMEEYDEVREIQSCFHVFHRECLDPWIHKGNVTCPLCRSNMLSEEKLESCRGTGDPWRRERMIFLFGEDVTCFS